MNQRDRAERITELFEEQNEEKSEEEQLSELADELESIGWTEQAQQLREESGMEVSEFDRKAWAVSEFDDASDLIQIRSLWGMYLNGSKYLREKAAKKLKELGFGDERVNEQKVLAFVA